MSNERTIHVHRDGEHVAAIRCDPLAVGWVVCEDSKPFTIEPGDRIDTAVTYTTRASAGKGAD